MRKRVKVNSAKMNYFDEVLGSLKKPMAQANNDV